VIKGGRNKENNKPRKNFGKIESGRGRLERKKVPRMPMPRPGRIFQKTRCLGESGKKRMPSGKLEEGMEKVRTNWFGVCTSLSG